MLFALAWNRRDTSMAHGKHKLPYDSIRARLCHLRRIRWRELEHEHEHGARWCWRRVDSSRMVYQAMRNHVFTIQSRLDDGIRRNHWRLGSKGCEFVRYEICDEYENENEIVGAESCRSSQFPIPSYLDPNYPITQSTPCSD